MLLALILLLAAAAGCSPTEEPVDGALLFRERCSACHGEQGQGAMGPPLRGQATEQIVREGRPAQGMPAFSEILDDEEIDAVVDYANRLGRAG